MSAAASAAGRRALVRVAALAPAAFLVPVGLGIVVSMVRLATTDNLDGGDVASIDAKALYLGQPLFQDPDDGYTGNVYTPLLPALVSVLLRLVFWDGWAEAVTLLATVALAAYVARAAYARADGRLGRLLSLVEAAGIGALAWEAVHSIDPNSFFRDRPDSLAWALALGGLLAVPSAAGGSRRSAVAAVALLSAGFWTKQTALVASIAVAIWLLMAVRSKAATAGFALRFLGTLAAVNLAILGLLNLLTSGWEYFLNFTVPGHQPLGDFGSQLRQYVPSLAYTFFGSMVLVLLFAVSIGAVAAIAWWRGSPRRRSPAALARELAAHGRSPSGQTASLLAVFVAVAIPASLVFRSKVGATNNTYVQIGWAVSILTAMGYRYARRDPFGALAAPLAVLCLAGATQVIHDDDGAVKPPDLYPATVWPTVDPPELRDYARDHLVYSRFYGDLNVLNRRRIFPQWNNLEQGLLAAGLRPDYLPRAIRRRELDGVFLYVPNYGPHPGDFGGGIEGRRWLQRLNVLIRRNYRPARTGPPGLMVRRGPPPPSGGL